MFRNYGNLYVITEEQFHHVNLCVFSAPFHNIRYTISPLIMIHIKTIVLNSMLQI